MRRLFVFLLILVPAGIGIFFWLRPEEGTAAMGPPVALCPGPDLYGYTCADGSAFAYVDAREETGLQLDDGAVQLPLPFPFTFYGTSYETVWAGSNGTLQFGTQNPRFNNVCLSDGPAADMGEMLAPYWDDLDLTFSGALETETVGEAPNRIFVVEWDDVPPYGQREESITFAVQLHEESNDIVFLYPDTSAYVGERGSGATVALQSERQGVVLQYSCDQAIIGDASALHFLHPVEPNEEIGREEEATTGENGAIVSLPPLKGPVAMLREQVSERGAAALPELRRHWLSQAQPLLFSWHWHDLDGDGMRDLIAKWRRSATRPQDTSIAVFRLETSATPGRSLDVTPVLISPLSSREVAFVPTETPLVRDLTQDGWLDILLEDARTRRVAIITSTGSGTTLHHLPDACAGPLVLRDVNGDDRIDVLRGECGTTSAPKTIYTWQTDHFAELRP